MPEDWNDLGKIANLLGLILTKDMTRSAATVTLASAGFSNRDIAALTGSTEGSVRAMLSQARKKALSEKTASTDG